MIKYCSVLQSKRSQLVKEYIFWQRKLISIKATEEHMLPKVYTEGDKSD
jgi:hypothetical protein